MCVNLRSASHPRNSNLLQEIGLEEVSLIKLVYSGSSKTSSMSSLLDTGSNLAP